MSARRYMYVYCGLHPSSPLIVTKKTRFDGHVTRVAKCTDALSKYRRWRTSRRHILWKVKSQDTQIHTQRMHIAINTHQRSLTATRHESFKSSFVLSSVQHSSILIIFFKDYCFPLLSHYVLPDSISLWPPLPPCFNTSLVFYIFPSHVGFSPSKLRGQIDEPLLCLDLRRFHFASNC